MVPANVLHAFTGRLHQLRFCSFPEYSANLVRALRGPMWASTPAKIHSRTQILCTTGEYVGELLFPQQGALPSPCAATAIDGSVVSTQAAL